MSFGVILHLLWRKWCWIREIQIYVRAYVENYKLGGGKNLWVYTSLLSATEDITNENKMSSLFWKFGKFNILADTLELDSSNIWAYK
jgi:hypothetical protein